MSTEKKSYSNQVKIIMNKLIAHDSKQATINAFQKHIDKVISSQYKVIQKLKQIKNAITENTHSLTDVKSKIADQTRESKQARKRVQEQRQSIIDRQVDAVKDLLSSNTHKAVSAIMNKLKPVKPKLRELGLQYKSHDLIAIKIDKEITPRQTKYLGDLISKTLKRNNINGSLGVAVRLPNRWANSKFVRVESGQQVKLPDFYDDESADEFSAIEFYISEEPLDIGGEDTTGYNDCLYTSLKEALGDNISWRHPSEFKKFLKLDRLDKVPISMIPIIEDKQNVAINVSGDYIYESVRPLTKVINLKLLNEHYTLNNKYKDFSKIPRVSYKELKPIIYDTKTFMCFDGFSEYELSISRRNSIYNFETEYILVHADDRLIVDGKSNLTLKEQYEQFIEDANILKQHNHGLINLYKLGNNHRAAKYLFDNFTKHIPNPQAISQIETRWINHATQGGLIWADDGYIGEAHSYDVSSQYPSIMASSRLNFPVMAGELKNIDVLPDILQYGIYRCIVRKSSDKHINRLFRFNVKSYYTHIDLNCARELGLKVELINDNRPNFLHYSRDKCLNCSELFKNYVNFLYDLKENKILRSNRVKQILNILLGLLGEVKTDKVHIVNGSLNKVIIPENTTLMSIKPYNDFKTIVEYSNNDRFYKTNFARGFCFVVSKARSDISKIILPYKDELIRLHTDGFLLKTKPTNIKTGNGLGQLKFEYTSKVQIVNVNKIIKLF